MALVSDIYLIMTYILVNGRMGNIMAMELIFGTKVQDFLVCSKTMVSWEKVLWLSLKKMEKASDTSTDSGLTMEN